MIEIRIIAANGARRSAIVSLAAFATEWRIARVRARSDEKIIALAC